MSRTQLIGISIAAKVALIAMLLVALLTDAQQFDGKALGSRLIFYPLGACLIALVWLVMRAIGKSAGDFPLRADILVTLPFLVDTVGNWLDLFDKVTWWDDLMHFTLWLLLSLGLAPLLTKGGVGRRWQQLLLIGGVGALIAVFWELGEYFLFVQDNPTERATAYQDTIGDLVLGSTGALIAGAIDAYLLCKWKSSSTHSHREEVPFLHTD